jgi:hypothetical protein
MDDIFGQDIKLDATGQAVVAANGELVLTQGAETGVQDVRLRLFTPLEELFYDIDFGSLLHYWIKEENTQANRDGFEAEVETRIDEDPRVETGTPSCSVLSWDDTGITAQCQWEFIGEDHPYNLVISYDANKQEMVIADVNPRPGL